MNEICDFKSLLSIDQQDLDGELMRNAVYAHRISELLQHASGQAISAKEQLSTYETKLRLSLISETDGQKGMSDTKAQLHVQVDPERQRLFQEYQSKREQQEAWIAMRDAWTTRSYSLKTLADLYAADYFTATSAGRTPEKKVQEEVVARPRRRSVE